MAGTLAMRVRAPENLETALMVMKQQWEWEVEFARFFTLPSNPSSAASPYLRLISRSTRKSRSRGTWLSSSSAASLKLISSDPSTADTLLLVVLRGMLLEEHFTSNLHFTWPQVSCVTECPPRGSRVVFASYRDCTGQIEKFALRFGIASDARVFMDVLKENMKGSVETGIPRSDLTETSSQSEFVSSNRLQYSGEGLGLVDHVATDVSPIAPVYDHNYMPNMCSLEPFQRYDRTHGDLPPSFTELMMSCSAEAEKAIKVPEEFDMKSQIMVTKVPEVFDIKSQIMRYMSDSSFHDMLTKVEQVIIDMGGDLSL